jgi:hypothetical protein
MWKSASSSEGPSGDHEANVRVVLSRILLAAGAVSLTVCIVFAVNVGQSYQRAVVKDDFAGFSLSHLLRWKMHVVDVDLGPESCLTRPSYERTQSSGFLRGESRSFAERASIAVAEFEQTNRGGCLCRCTRSFST